MANIVATAATERVVVCSAGVTGLGIALMALTLTPFATAAAVRVSLD